MNRVWGLAKKWAWMVVVNERGGGSKPQPAQVIQAPPPPSVSQTAEESLAAQLKFNPQLTQQALELQQQFGLPFAQNQLDILSQTSPLYRSILESQFPQIGTLSQQVQQRLLNPEALSASQLTAQEAIRDRSRQALSRQVRERANLGGTLFGGRAQEQESRALQELEQGFTAQDIGLQQQNRAQTLQELLSLFQIAGLPAQQINVPQFGQSVVPGGDTLFNALVQNQGNFGIQPATQGSPGFFGSFLRPFGF